MWKVCSPKKEKGRNTMRKAMLMVAVVYCFGATSAANAQGLTKRDQLRIKAQSICPISGNNLGTHGSPIKVRVGKETVYLCCKGCLKGRINPRHWATIHANFAKAQGVCPVMKHKLPANPKWIIVQGCIVYVCCPPCTDTIAKQPETYLQRVDQYYAISLKAQSPSQ